MVDIHSHILPEVDDGAKSWQIAVAMCRMAAEDGIEHMVATPHANDQYGYDREWLKTLLAELRTRAGGAPALSLGCDFHFSFDNLQSLARTPHGYTIEDTPYLLVELSDYAIPPNSEEMLFDLLRRDLRPILTHPERNPILQRSPERVLEWVETGCLVQVTASSLEGQWGERAKQAAEWLLRRAAVHVIATDAHSDEWRPPVLSRGRDLAAAIVGADIARCLVEDNPRAIVEGRAIPYFPPLATESKARGIPG